MPKPICAKCKREMNCEKNEALVRDREAKGYPSTYWYGDRFKCPSCEIQIIVGFGRPMSAEMGEALAAHTACLEFAR